MYFKSLTLGRQPPLSRKEVFVKSFMSKQSANTSSSMLTPTYRYTNLAATYFSEL